MSYLPPLGRVVFLLTVFVTAASAQEPAEKKGGDPQGAPTWTLSAGDGKFEIAVDTSDTPDLTAWARDKLSPVLVVWYPKIVELLPSEGFEAPAKLSVTFRGDYRGVAATSGTRIQCAAAWFRNNLEGEAKGAVVHELVHVVQQYGGARRRNPQAKRAPSWLVEGIADQIRWFLYEPESRGAEISRRGLERARYDGGYRVSANFIDWAVRTHDAGLVKKLNAAIREGRYREEIWGELCGGHALAALGEEWKKSLVQKLGVADGGATLAVESSASVTKASDGAPAGSASAPGDKAPADDKSAGWKNLFDGKSLDGWHSFGRSDVRPGWKVKDGTLACVDPHDAGDLCTNDRYDWFELELEYRIASGGNSGIMYHVTDEAKSAWATGPEFQLEDNAKAADPVRCGWLYALYQPPDDPKTGKPLDATKPAGEWNRVRLLISEKLCEHEINGVKYFEYVLDSDDFRGRVAKSKFHTMPLFAKTHKGYISLQGDHGEVAFRNVRIRAVPAAKAPGAK
jgi:hypothetical protein